MENDNELKSFKKFYNANPDIKPNTPELVEGESNPKKLPGDIVEILDARIGDEYTAHYFYRNAANWCKNANYNKAASFFDAEASSELEHAQGLQDYLIQWNLLPAIPQAPTRHDFEGLVDIIKKAYDLEYGLFTKYSGDQKALFGEHPATFNFIQKYVDIQNSSVAEYSDLLNAIELINADNKLDVLFFEKNYF
jgi:ferritin